MINKKQGQKSDNEKGDDKNCKTFPRKSITNYKKRTDINNPKMAFNVLLSRKCWNIGVTDLVKR
uniref:Uncharacterized protein n=1 Tax=Romanomermis culicivorax TaxID=13658 RepID=A0A915KHV6_ROMCU